MNFIKKLFHRKAHTRIPTYFGMSVVGYECLDCGYKYYVKKHQLHADIVLDVVEKLESKS